MIEDVSPGLLEEIRTRFISGYDSSDEIKTLLLKFESRSANYEDANQFAIRIGELLSDCYKQCLSSEVLPDGKMYYNIAKSVIEPTIKDGFSLVSGYCLDTQTLLNQIAGIGLKVQEPLINQDRINGIINTLSHAEVFDDKASLLEEPIINMMQSHVTDYVQVNAEFHYNAGLNPTIERRQAGGCCKWCSNLQGRYAYNEAPHDIYRRHENCRCTVIYNPDDSTKKIKGVHGKGEYDSEREARIAESKANEERYRQRAEERKKEFLNGKVFT